jgi:pimeloyl-ACP methyl ester carboxylesterase
MSKSTIFSDSLLPSISQKGILPSILSNGDDSSALSEISIKKEGSFKDPFLDELIPLKENTEGKANQEIAFLDQSPILITSVEEADRQAKDIITGLPPNSPQSDLIFTTAFGNNYDQQKLDSILQNIAQGDFSDLPKIQIISSDISKNANGGYDKLNNIICLSDDFVRNHNTQEIMRVLLEEYGHYIDARINTVDAEGDEGEILKELITGEQLSPEVLASLKAENDHGLMMINGQEIAIEMSSISGTSNTLQTAQNVVLNSTPQLFTGFVGDSVVNNYLKFQVTTPSILSVELTGLTKDANVRLLNAQGNFIQASYNKGTATDSFPYQLNAGTYFIQVYREALGDNTNYSLNLASVPLTETISTLQTAKDVGVLDANTQTFTGTVNDLVIHNYYKFKVTNPSSFSVELTGLTKDANVRLLDAQGKFIQASYNKGTATDAFTYELATGDYFVHVYREAIGDNTSYTLKVSAPSLSSPLAPIDGAGNTKDTARNIGTLTTTQTFKDLVGVNDQADWYSFYVAEPGTANIVVNSDKGATIEFYNSKSMFSRSSTATDLTRTEYIYEPGQYFVKISQYAIDQDTNYTLALATTSSVMDLGSLSGNHNISSTNNTAYYGFKLDQNSIVRASSNFPDSISLQVLDNSYKNTVAMWLDKGATLNAGTYYLAVSNVPGYSIPSSFTLNLQATATSRYDNGGLDFRTARDLGTITTSESVTDFIDPTDKLDYYSFTVDSKSSVNLNLTAITGSATVGVNLYNAQYGYVGSVNGNPNPLKPLTATLEAGKYYVLINDITGSTNVQYRLNVNVQSLTPNDAIGNTFAQAKDLGAISPGYPITPIKDAIGETDSADWFRFSTNKLGNILPVLDGLTTPVSLELMRIESNGTLTSLGKLDSNGVSKWQPAFNNLPVGNYALILTSNSAVSSPYTLNISAVSTNIKPEAPKLNLNGTYSSNQDIIVTGTVSDVNGVADIDEVQIQINGQTYSVKNFTQSSTNSNVANFTLNIGKLPIGFYGYSARAYDKSRDSSDVTMTMGQTPIQVVQQITTPSTGSSFQVAPEILPYYSALSSAQQTKLGTAISANATNTNGSWRQDFQNGSIIAWAGSTPMVYFNDGTSFELSNSLIQTLPIVGTLTSSGSISGNLSSSDAKDQFRSAFYDDYSLSGFTSGQQVRLTLTGSGFVPQIYLIDALTGQTQQQSTVIQNGNQTILDFVVPTTGNYRVRVTSGNANQMGSYTLASGSIPVDNPSSGGGSTGSTGTLPRPTYHITEPVNEAKEWRANLFQWDRNNGATPPVDFYDGGSNNPNWIGTLNLGSNSNKSLKFDWGTGTVKGNSNLPADGFAIRAYTWADFDGGKYQFNVRADDGFQLLAKRQSDGKWFYITPQDQWQNAGYGNLSTVTAQLPAGRYDLHIHYFEHGGEAKMDFSWDKVTTTNPVSGGSSGGSGVAVGGGSNGGSGVAVGDNGIGNPNASPNFFQSLLSQIDTTYSKTIAFLSSNIQSGTSSKTSVEIEDPVLKARDQQLQLIDKQLQNTWLPQQKLQLSWLRDDIQKARDEVASQLGNDGKFEVKLTQFGTSSQSAKAVDDTWIIIHGWNDSPQGWGINNLAQAVQNYSLAKPKQVLVLDWSEGSKTGNDYFVPNAVRLTHAAGRIESVADAVVKLIQEAGLVGKKINFIGHSLGAYVSAEISERLTKLGAKPEQLILLDPANNFTLNTLGNSYNPNVDYKKVAKFSRAFYGSAAGDTASNAHESFKIEYNGQFSNPSARHGDVVTLFANFLQRPQGGVSRYFGLEDNQSLNFVKHDPNWDWGNQWRGLDGTIKADWTSDGWIYPKEFYFKSSKTGKDETLYEYLYRIENDYILPPTWA